MTRPLFFFYNPIFEGDDSSNIPDRIGNHGPRQVGNFPSPQASFYRQQDHDPVSRWVSGVVKARRSQMSSSDRIFARFPSMNKLIVMLMTHCESKK
jgi:hypothetical protein